MHTTHANGQQAAPRFAQHPHRSLVKVNTALNLDHAGQPLLAGVLRLLAGTQPGAHVLPIRNAGQHMNFPPRGDNGFRAGTCGKARSTQLGHHATPPQDAALASHGIQRSVVHIANLHQFSIRVAAGIFVIKPVLIGKQYQGVRIDQVRYQGCQGIVVTKAYLFSNHRIVFIDHRHHTQLQQGIQGTPGIQVAIPRNDIIVSQQHLGGGNIVAFESRFIALHQT